MTMTRAFRSCWTTESALVGLERRVRRVDRQGELNALESAHARAADCHGQQTHLRLDQAPSGRIEEHVTTGLQVSFDAFLLNYLMRAAGLIEQRGSGPPNSRRHFPAHSKP